MTQALEKRLAAEAAVEEISDGMLVGLGTGTTSAFAVQRIGQRVREGLRIQAIASSAATGVLAASAGIPLIAMDDVAQIDLAIDGVDEIDPAFRAIKGGGGAMLREKVVARSSSRMVAIADSSKFVIRLGRRPIPVEVLPFALSFVQRQIEALGAAAELRLADGKPFRTDQDNLILDCRLAGMSDLSRLAASLSDIPGALGHGLFLTEIDAVYVASSNGVRRLE